MASVVEAGQAIGYGESLQFLSSVAQTCNHVVEDSCQRAKLAAGHDGEVHLEITSSDLRGADRESIQRPDDGDSQDICDQADAQ